MDSTYERRGPGRRALLGGGALGALGALGAAGIFLPGQGSEAVAARLPAQDGSTVHFYHLCFVVPDLERAMRDFENGVGTTWNEPRDGTLGDWDYRIVFSHGGPPYTELIQGDPGSPWDAPDGPRCDHVGFWTDPLDRYSRHLVESGFPVDFDARPYGRDYVYHRMPSTGFRIELLDLSLQPGFLESWDPDGQPMPPLPRP